MYTPSLRSENGKAVGFTLLELLIVIGIMVILGTVLVLVLNPAETLKKARDNQRISDLATLKTAVGLYVTEKTSPTLDNSNVFGSTDLAATNGFCLNNTPNIRARISYSLANATVSSTVNVAEGADVTASSVFSATTGAGEGAYLYPATTAVAQLVDGTGWIPVKFTDIAGGSPLSNLPVDPTNTVTTKTAPTNADLVYRYTCQDAATSPAPSFVFELNAVLESTAYTSTDNKMAKDGGDNDSYYEVGTSLKLLGTGTAY